ncbi:MAG: AAA family ATPase [Planctomycetes bacterium]|nr:AAA family ATPase [Planctomycetota bacterium]
MERTTDDQEALEVLGVLWERERIASRDRFREERDLLPFADRIRRGQALRALEVDEVAPAAGDMSLLWLTCGVSAELEGFRLSPGQPVLLWRDRPDQKEALAGTLTRRRGGRLGVMVHGDTGWAEEKALNLDRDDSDATFRRGAQALHFFREAPAKEPTGRLRTVLFGDDEPTFGPPDTTPLIDGELNEPQREAAAHALAAKTVALIHGPPGTGKTRTLVEVIRRHVAAGRRVLAAAASNQAIDNLGERLVAAGIDVLRLGHPARVSPALEPCLLSTQLAASEETRLAREWLREAQELRRGLNRTRRGTTDWKARREERRQTRNAIGRLHKDARHQFSRTRRALIEGASVVCSTAAGADAKLLGSMRWDVVVLDEATQAADPIALSALSRGDVAVLAGDPCQLPPTVIDAQAERDGLGTTLFERLAAQSPASCRLLEVQHRMHASIAAHPNASHYEGRLVNHESVAAHTLADLGVADDPLRPGPLILIDTAGKGWDDERGPDDPSTRNPQQAERTAAEVRRLISRGLPPRDVAVIAPYDAQVRLLRSLLEEERQAGLSVRSIDGFQGQEREAVIVDLVRSNFAGQVGFLSDTRRLNVAFTRARRLLLVVGDTATITRLNYLAGFLETVEAGEGYVSVWSDEADLL